MIWFGVLTGLGILFCGLRFFLGPGLADRMVAIDIMTTVLIAGMVVLALWFDNRMFLDVSLALASVSFVAMIVVGRFLEAGDE